ncbi:MAG TPA: J domain-containing protein [Acidobacteriaceae bacterium]|jgi:curved DNA-binding protein CbpA|nr:J domain-containing protein [Acidobacteriaceae bacterium]
MLGTEIPDYYEFLEISPQATQETVHRVYRYLAARYHPDHAGTGNPEKFAQLATAYKVLSDPALRAEYNAQRATRQATFRNPMSCTVDFMDQVAGDLNRRLAVLAILYYRRRMYPDNPEVDLTEIEQRMGFPRDYLEFTTWYLTKKRYVTKADNAEFTLTVEGVDFIETQRTSVPLLERLLTSGSQTDNNEVLGRLPASQAPPPDSSCGWQYPVEAPALELVSQL